MDQCFNSPSITKKLVPDMNKAEIVIPKEKFKSSINEPGAISSKGIKFENEEEFDKHMKRQVCDEIRETKKEIVKPKTISIIGNPGFHQINQNILFCLDHKSQMGFRKVCQSWKQQVDQPFFWIKKLNLKSHPKGLGNKWIDLVGRIQKGSYLEKEVTNCLMKWYGMHQSWDEDEIDAFYLKSI